MTSDALIEPDELIGILESFHEFGQPTIIQTREKVSYFINDFWTSKQRQGAIGFTRSVIGPVSSHS